MGVSDVLRVCYEDVSDHLDMSRWSGVSLTCRQQVACVAADPDRKYYEEVANFLVTGYENVTTKLATSYGLQRESYDETPTVELSLYWRRRGTARRMR